MHEWGGLVIVVFFGAECWLFYAVGHRYSKQYFRLKKRLFGRVANSGYLLKVTERARGMAKTWLKNFANFIYFKLFLGYNVLINKLMFILWII